MSIKSDNITLSASASGKTASESSVTENFTLHLNKGDVIDLTKKKPLMCILHLATE